MEEEEEMDQENKSKDVEEEWRGKINMGSGG